MKWKMTIEKEDSIRREEEAKSNNMKEMKCKCALSRRSAKVKKNSEGRRTGDK